MRRLDILVADDHPIFLEGLRAVLSRPQGDKFAYSIVGTAHDGPALQALLHRTSPDLLLLNFGLLAQLPVAKKGDAKLRVLMVTDSSDPRLARAAFRAGADGYMLKSGSKSELFEAIEQVVAGQRFLGSGIAATGAARPLDAEDRLPEQHLAQQYGLTRRELEVMRLASQALTNRQIAEQLYISEQTAGVHRKNIMRKLGVNSTAKLMQMGYEHYLV